MKTVEQVLGKVSLKTRMHFISYVLVMAGVVVTSFLVGTGYYFNLQLQRYENAVEIKSYVDEMKINFADMEIGMYSYLGTGDGKAKAAKEKADADYDRNKTELMATLKPSDSEIRDIIEGATSTENEALNPAEAETIKLIATDKAKAMQVYDDQVAPNYNEVREVFDMALKVVKQREQTIKADLNRFFELAGIAFGTLMVVGLGVGIFLLSILSRSIVDPIVTAVARLTEEAKKASDAAISVSSSSHELAQSTTEQAAALQETAASVEEMNAMVSKNAESALKSGAAADESTAVATEGKTAVDGMISAMKEINLSNAEIAKQIEESNSQITSITKVIAEIGNKTKVINDIVFQTKLLSFNASVEAARAGEHGKGFAVVAEEVGNLAQMSGNAAKEIAQMLNASIQRVESIVGDTKVKVERLVAAGKAKVASGTQTAEQSGKALDEVVRRVSVVNQMVLEISTASQEQAQGIGEITKAISQLDQVTHQNSTVSQAIANNAEQMSSQSVTLNQVVLNLDAIIKGTGQKTDAPANPKPAAKTKKPQKTTHAAHATTPEPVPAAPADNVVPIRPKAATPPVEVLQSAAGGGEVPQENDPRFKEV